VTRDQFWCDDADEWKLDGGYPDDDYPCCSQCGEELSDDECEACLLEEQTLMEAAE